MANDPSYQIDNPPAFPQSQGQIQGMRLRDYFAGQALAGMFANHEWLCAMKRTANEAGYPAAQAAAAAAYEIADAMLNARSKADGHETR